MSREADPEAVVVVRRGQIFWSTGIIAALAGGIASFLVVRAEVLDLKSRADKIEAKQETTVTKDDLKEVNQRLDGIYNILIERQEAHPPRKGP